MGEGNENENFRNVMTNSRRKLSARKSFKKRSRRNSVVKQNGNVGCYLTTDDASNGSLYLNWKEYVLQGSIARIITGKDVPKFKFNTNDGKKILAYDVTVNKKNLYDAWCRFIQLGKKYDSKFQYYSND